MPSASGPWPRPTAPARRGTEVGRWLLRRALQAIVTFVLAVVLLFFLSHVLPGDPLSRLGESRPLTAAEIAALRARYGLDQPLGSQLGSFLAGLARGDLGTSIEYGRPVSALIAERLPATLLLGGTVLLLNFTVGLWLGVRQAVRRGRERTGGSPPCRSPATPCRRSGSAWCWHGSSGWSWRLLPAAGMQDPLLPRAACSRAAPTCSATSCSRR